jgi:membrane protease YdiL (CAAX protease family)
VARRSAARIVLPDGLVVVARIVGACLAYLAVLDTVYIIAYGVGQSLVPDDARGAFGLVSQGVADGAALVTVLLIWRLVDRRPIVQLGLRTTGVLRRVLKGAAVATLMMSFVVFVNFTLIDGAAWDVNSDVSRAVLALVGGLVGFGLQGPAEEVLFRGYMLENVREQWGVRQAVVVSSLAFGLLHAANPAFGPLPFINLVLFGVATALYKIYIDDDQLWGVFAIHAVWNWLQQVVFGLPNSGIVTLPDNALFTVTPNTSLPGVVWGSGFGPEGTLATTLVLLALIGVCARRARRTRTTRRLVTRRGTAVTS